MELFITIRKSFIWLIYVDNLEMNKSNWLWKILRIVLGMLIGFDILVVFKTNYFLLPKHDNDRIFKDELEKSWFNGWRYTKFFNPIIWLNKQEIKAKKLSLQWIPLIPILKIHPLHIYRPHGKNSPTRVKKVQKIDLLIISNVKISC